MVNSGDRPSNYLSKVRYVQFEIHSAGQAARPVGNCGHAERGTASDPRNGEAQKLVDRIEKKVSTQRKNRSSKTPSKPPQPKRNLRVVKWIGTIPAIGVCTYCSRQFKVPLESMKRVADAQWNLDLQFKEHKCKREDASQAAARIVRNH